MHANKINIILRLFMDRRLITYKNHKLDKIKNMLACTNLSKLNRSSQWALGTYLPGVQHSIKITTVQMKANAKEYLKIVFTV